MATTAKTLIPQAFKVERSGKHLRITGKNGAINKDKVVVKVYLFDKKQIEDFNQIEIDDYPNDLSLFERLIQGIASALGMK